MTTASSSPDPEDLQPVRSASNGLDASQTLIGLAGDWEANIYWARRALTQFAQHGITTVLHLGDLTVGPERYARQFTSDLDQSCREHGITIFLTPGNHEDYPRMRGLTADSAGLKWMSPHIGVLPRGHRWQMGGRTFVSLGGAPSVDYVGRVEGKDWFPEEAITDQDVERVIVGGPADVMLTHDSPAPSTPAVERILQCDRSNWTEEGLRYAAQGRARLTRAFEAIKPRLLAHGHYHVHDEASVTPPGWAHPCTVLSLNADNAPGNLAVLDLEDWSTVDDAGVPGIRPRWL